MRELCSSLDSTVATIDQLNGNAKGRNLTVPLMTLLEIESGMPAQIDSLRERCEECSTLIKGIIIHDQPDSDDLTDFGKIIPKAFFERNEIPWRGRVCTDVIQKFNSLVHIAANDLAKQVKRDFWGPDDPNDLKQSVIVQDIFNNMFAIKSIPVWAENREKYYHPRDRKGQLLRNRFTTEKVELALSRYIEASEKAASAVSEALMSLSEELSEKGHLRAVVQSAHTNLILSVTFHHAAAANRKGWELASCENVSVNSFKNLWPYWMDKSQAVTNSFDLDINNMFLLTAPNMSGKSTLMRSTAAAALLTGCGLCAPVDKGTKIKRFDRIFVRGASADVPSENKSAFGSEMGDVACMLRQCGSNSLIFVDELGRGTSDRAYLSCSVFH